MMNAPSIPASWPRAYPRLGCVARFKTEPEDFEVDEALAFVPEGAGEHLYLRLEKRDTETRRLAEDLARLYGVSPVDVGYAGMKDKRALTRQWFSVHTQLAVEVANEAGLGVIEASRHPRKLRRGQLSRNTFTIRLRDVQGDGWQERLDTLSAQGVPNYFGPQRFGGDNLERAMQWLPQRRRRSISHFKKGLYLSVLRSYLFNEILGRRVSDGSWRDLLSGDVASGVGDGVGEGAGATAPLWGRGRSATTEAAAEVEASVLAPHARLCDDLEYAGVQQQRRALVLYPQTLDWQTSGAEVQLRFGLAPGCFATSFLLEAFDLQHQAESSLAVNAPESGRM